MAELELAFRVVDVWQLMVALVTDGFDAGVMVIVTGINGETHGVLDQVILTIPFPALPFILPPAGLGIDAFPAIVDPLLTPPI